MTRLSDNDKARHTDIVAALADLENARAQIRLLTERVIATEQLARRWQTEIAKRYNLRHGDHISPDGNVRRTRFVPSAHTGEHMMLDKSPRYFPVQNGSLTVTVLPGDAVLVLAGGRDPVDALYEGESREFRSPVYLSSRSSSKIALTRTTETAIHPEQGPGPILTADGWQH